ncbi:unnamed protein product [Effrenium voratum]|nr:unnamed protein product [Effrenium voratum]
MSILMSTLSPLAEGPTGCRTEMRPRILHHPDGSPDAQQKEEEGVGSPAARAEHPRPYTKVHGNATSQERRFHRTWSLHKKLPEVCHPHPKPWCHSSCAGKKEPPEGVNTFHRVWLMDVGKRGRWNRHKKKEFYEQQDKEMMSKVPHELKFNCTDTHYRFWTHLLDGGVTAGGQEKLDYGYRGPSSPKQHFYLGKFENVKHHQRILATGFIDRRSKKLRELHLDTRDEFDNRLHDDMIQYNDKELLWAKKGSFDCFRPKNTASCPQLGADFVYRAG